MLTDAGEQHSHDLIHMVIFYMTQTCSRTAQNPATQINCAMKINFRYIIYLKNRKQDL